MNATRYTKLKVGPPTATELTRIVKGTFVVDVGSVGAGAAVEVTQTITGVTTADVVVVNAPVGLEASLLVGSARVTAADTIKFRVSNPTGAPIDPASATYSYVTIRS